MQLVFFLRAGRGSAAVAAREFLDPACGIDKFLFTGKKGMTSGTNADFDVFACGARVINGATSTGDRRRVIIRMDICFHR